MSFVRWTAPHQKWDETPGVVQRSDRKREKEKQLAEAYAVVDKRDQNRCRATGATLAPAAVDPKQRREHHHLRGRRVRPDWIYRPERICLVSAFVHDLITRGWIEVEGTDARKPLFFSWNDDIAKGRRPLVIKRHNPRGEQEK